MNPFDLRGPEFLVFYCLFGGALFFVLEMWRRFTENNEVPRMNMSDPYEIAFLRGGKNEALRIATISLVDRGLIKTAGTKLQSESGGATLVKRPIEQAVLSYFSTPKDAWAVFGSSGAEVGWKPYEEELIWQGLLPTKAQGGVRIVLRIIAAMILLLVGGYKIDVALQRGRHNVSFLIILMIGLAVFVVWRNPPRTPAGDIFLKNLRELFSGLKGRISSLKPGGSSNELALALGVFGVGILSSTTGFAYIKSLYPKASSASGCGSSCGASCGASCGSGCGGGGCGGGCGGCGG